MCGLYEKAEEVAVVIVLSIARGVDPGIATNILFFHSTYH
jgi:hypothetical protein